MSKETGKPTMILGPRCYVTEALDILSLALKDYIRQMLSPQGGWGRDTIDAKKLLEDIIFQKDVFAKKIVDLADSVWSIRNEWAHPNTYRPKNGLKLLSTKSLNFQKQ